jgi:hypothetical protein
MRADAGRGVRRFTTGMARPDDDNIKHLFQTIVG